MNYYTLTADMDEGKKEKNLILKKYFSLFWFLLIESDSDDPSWLLTTSESTKKKVQQETYVQASAVHGEESTVHERTNVHKPNESKSLEDAVRNSESLKLIHELLFLFF